MYKYVSNLASSQSAAKKRMPVHWKESWWYSGILAFICMLESENSGSGVSKLCPSNDKNLFECTCVINGANLSSHAIIWARLHSLRANNSLAF